MLRKNFICTGLENERPCASRMSGWNYGGTSEKGRWTDVFYDIIFWYSLVFFDSLFG
jgi:hypothetical protein